MPLQVEIARASVPMREYLSDVASRGVDVADTKRLAICDRVAHAVIALRDSESPDGTPPGSTVIFLLLETVVGATNGNLDSVIGLLDLDALLGDELASIERNTQSGI